MRRSGHIPWGEFRVGIVIFIGLAIFLWASIRGGSAFFENRTELRVIFRNVDGLTEGSPVWFRGLEVGSVSGIDVREENDSSFVFVRLKVRPEIVSILGADASARIDAINFFGEKYVDLTPGSIGAAALDPSVPLVSEEPVRFGTIVKSGEAGLEDLRQAVADLSEILAHVRSGEGSLGRLVADRGFHDDMRRFLQETAALARSLDVSQAKTADALTAAATRLDTLLDAVHRGEGTLGLMATDPRLYQSLAGASAGADTVLGRVAAGEGSVGRAFTDEQAYLEFTRTLERVNKLLEDIQKNPKKYFKFSVF